MKITLKFDAIWMAASVSIFLVMHVPQGVPSNSEIKDRGAIIKWIYDGARISEFIEC